MNIENYIDTEKSILQEINLPSLRRREIKVFIKRDDLLHHAMSGNKWRKLKYNLIEAKRAGHSQIITFGGAYSNHIYAVASAGKELGFETIGIIRGEEYSPLNPTLRFALNHGMKLFYLPRSIYRSRNESEFQQSILEKYGPGYLVPEGGTNCLALRGVGEIISEINIEYDYICSAVGSGGTAAGIITHLPNDKQFLGFPVFKNSFYMDEIVYELINECHHEGKYNWQLNHEYHFGGFAKINEELVSFIDYFEMENGIPLDPIYTSKMLCGLDKQIAENYFEPGTKIIALHTGGLQGLDGMRRKMNQIRSEL